MPAARQTWCCCLLSRQAKPLRAGCAAAVGCTLHQYIFPPVWQTRRFRGGKREAECLLSCAASMLETQAFFTLAVVALSSSCCERKTAARRGPISHPAGCMAWHGGLRCERRFHRSPERRSHLQERPINPPARESFALASHMHPRPKRGGVDATIRHAASKPAQRCKQLASGADHRRGWNEASPSPSRRSGSCDAADHRLPSHNAE